MAPVSTATTNGHSETNGHVKSKGEKGPTLSVFDSSSEANQRTGALGQTTSGKKLKIREYPKFDSLEQERLYRKQHLAAAYRVFADRGFDEGTAGHISVRDPILTDHFCLSTCLH